MPLLLESIGIALDAATIIASGIAAWFWYKASDNHIRRIHAHESLDYHDLNRVIVAINRNAIRNRRAALASAVAALLLGIDLAFAGLMS